MIEGSFWTSLGASIGVYSNSTTPFYSVPQQNFGVEVFYSMEQNICLRLIPFKLSRGVSFYTSLLQMLEIYRLSNVQGAFIQYLRNFRAFLDPPPPPCTQGILIYLTPLIQYVLKALTPPLQPKFTTDGKTFPLRCGKGYDNMANIFWFRVTQLFL